MRARRQSGFTLIEVIAAFVILSLVLATSFQIFSRGMQRAGDLEDYSRALAVAQSQLALAGVGDNFPEGQTAGESEDRRYHWTVTTTKYEEPAEPGKNAIAQAFYMARIGVRVTWRSASEQEKHLELSTLVLGRSL